MRALTLTAGVLLAGCSSQLAQVRADYDRAADFSKYKTVAFVSELGAAKGGFTTLSEQRMKNAVKLQLERRGYTFVEAEPDLLVNVAGKLTRKQEVTASSSGPAYAPYYGYRGGYYAPWPGYTTVTTRDVTDGTLSVDLVDAKSKQLVWEGLAEGRVTDEMREDAERVIFQVVSDIFDKYPFRAAGAPPQ
ncbi:MAG: DUF4136 domain-containing protein [Myxococcales bacterium]|nr:DUF4136 domain-containing protein [Myxococcales bacterium]